MTDNGQAEGPVLVWEGQAAMFAAPDGSRVIRYETSEGDQFFMLPAELVPALEALRANPAMLVNIANSPLGAVARRMAGLLAKAAESAVSM